MNEREHGSPDRKPEQGGYRKESGTNTPLVSAVKHLEVLNPSTSEKPLSDLRAQLEMVGTIFDADITLLPDNTLQVLDGHILSRISPWGELEQVDLDLKGERAIRP